MARNDKRFDFQKFQSRWDAEKRALPIQIARTAENEYKKNFELGGFLNNYLEKWSPRKVADAGRAILVKTGRLKRSIRAIPGFNMKKITIASDVPYAQAHNEGTKTLTKRQFIGPSYAINEKVKKLIADSIARIFN